MSASRKPGTDAPTREETPVDPRAVRVRVASTTALEGDPVRVVAPPATELRLFETELGEPGVLGGVVPSRNGDRDPVEAGERVVVDGTPVTARLERHDATRAILVSADEGGAIRRTPILLGAPRPGAGGVIVREAVVDGWRFELEIEPERLAALRERSRRGRAAAGAGGPLEVRAIIPGRIVAISAAPGDAVAAGQQLLVLEAMKMQNELRAPREGTIVSVAVAVGANVEVGDVLMVIG